MADKQTHKLSDEDFLAILRENYGAFERTSLAIKQQYGFSYSRQAVRERAKKLSDHLDDMRDDLIDCSKSKMVACVLGEPVSPSQLKAAAMILNNIDKFYPGKLNAQQKPEQVYVLDGEIIRF